MEQVAEKCSLVYGTGANPGKPFKCLSHSIRVEKRRSIRKEFEVSLTRRASLLFVKPQQNGDTFSSFLKGNQLGVESDDKGKTSADAR
ncbi:hypothetical protein ACG33_02360 [Steroidobacter denitrificans]|uniref:Uncharacterized protein n=1 Tax=Steroidobacter denitrificans TaxID=465721 RepID=A0A127F6B0_STEDE|nr:hypothetical protein ACG33_02360 [Steroidobacter denitrificans]